MTARDGTKRKNRRGMAVLGGAVGAFAAAAAMATGSAVSAAPAKADFEDLLDPIIQPILTSLTDSLAVFDPAAALDLTSWTDSLLSSLNSIDFALPSTADAASAVAAAAEPAAATGTYDIPLTVLGGTEPTVQATVDGTSNTLLVDTGSSGLVVPWESLGSNDLSALENLFTLGFPTSFGESGYSGGVDYIYLTYDNVPVDYGTGAGALDTTNAPIDVEIFSWPTAAGSPSSFEQFLTDDSSTGILGIGDSGNAGPSVGPFESLSFSGVTVDIPQGELVVGANAGTPLAIGSLGGGPTVNDNLTEVVTSGNTTIGSGSVSDDIDSGGVYGTIPSTIAQNVAQGDEISVYDGNTLLYQYTVGTDSFGTSEAPTVFTGASGVNGIDSGIEPYLEEPIYISYGGTDGAITFDLPGSGTA
jgi:hypothetical protein